MDPMINETILTTAIPALMPLFETIRNIIASLQWLVGGMFGLYLVLVFLRWKESRMVGRILKEIRDDIKNLSENMMSMNTRMLEIEEDRKKGKGKK